MAKKAPSINTDPPSPASTTSTEIGEEGEPYDSFTPCSINTSFSSATTFPQRSKLWAAKLAFLGLFVTVVFAYVLPNFWGNVSSASSSPISNSLSLPRWKENAIPTPGKTYIITALDLPQGRASIVPPSPDQDHNRKAITLVQGQLKLMDLKVANFTTGCWNWQCITKEGWLGFRNVASGTYLGRNGKLEVVANEFHCKQWEWFCVRRVSHVEGSGGKEEGKDGYVMLTRHWDSLMWLDVSNEAAATERWYLTLSDRSDRSALWSFVEVGDHDG